MNLFLAVVLAIVGATPLIFLVRRADEVRLEAQRLDLHRYMNLITKKEYERKKHKLLGRSLWRPRQ